MSTTTTPTANTEPRTFPLPGGDTLTVSPVTSRDAGARGTCFEVDATTGNGTLQVCIETATGLEPTVGVHAAQGLPLRSGSLLAGMIVVPFDPYTGAYDLTHPTHCHATLNQSTPDANVGEVAGEFTRHVTDVLSHALTVGALDELTAAARPLILNHLAVLTRRSIADVQDQIAHANRVLREEQERLARVEDTIAHLTAPSPTLHG